VAPSYLPNDEARVLEQGASLKVQVGPSGLFVLHFNKGCVTLGPCHFTLKKYLKAKEELWKLKYFTIHAKIYLIFKKLSSKRNQNPSRYYYNSIIPNLKFQQHKPKYHHLSKILI
jgi:hypothetical protein